MCSEKHLIVGLLLTTFLAFGCQGYPQGKPESEISWPNFWMQVHRLKNYYNFLVQMEENPQQRIQRSTICANIWDDGCINGQVVGAGSDSGFLESGGTPGKRFIS
ncbi:uncharacterized protein LOC129795912 [Lutzomyia longipalpis]|uniref:uncharacterized protein LOC129795912 n=1 Tax=Lutzomyia longipalpis TaxID=7200 RepID=UPI0024840369|nr:uncharacterized protein LOC129795912 [Lutzomyia longipalpis]